MAENRYDEINLTSSLFLLLERFTVLLYDKSSALGSVDEARLDLFRKKNTILENLPRTQVHLCNTRLHLLHVCFFLL